jgi:hypothetical protein
VRTALVHISLWVGYTFDEADWQAVENALPETRWDPPEQWYDYPIVGSRTLTVFLARADGADPVGIRVQGELDEVLAARIETIIAILADVVPADA